MFPNFLDGQDTFQRNLAKNEVNRGFNMIIFLENLWRELCCGYKESTHPCKMPGFCDIKKWNQDKSLQNFSHLECDL